MLQPIRIRSVDIPRVLLAARAFDPRREAPMDRPLRQAVDDLFAALERQEAPYLLVGGIALLHYVEGRNTEDIDLIMALTDARNIPGLEIIELDRDFARARFGMLDVDLLLTDNAFFAEVLEQLGTEMEFMDRRIHVVTPDGMLVLKLYALPSLYRQGKVSKVRLYETDIAMLLQAQPLDVDAPLVALEPHLAAADLAELRSILSEIRHRIDRSDRFGSPGG